MAKKKRKKKPSLPAAPQPPTPALSAQMEAQLQAWALESAKSLGLVLLDVEVVAKGGWKILVTAQRPGTPEPGEGITIEECAQLSRGLELLLDTDERVPENYTLEVSSPGIERVLRKPEHFAQVVGQQIRVTMREAIEGEYTFMGLLRETVGEGPAHIELFVKESQKHDGETLTLEIDAIKKAHLAYDFGT